MRPLIRVFTLASVLLVEVVFATGQPRDIDALYRAGVEALGQDRPFEAVELLNQVAAVNPTYRDVQLLLGQSCYLAGLVRPAKQHLERVLEIDPNHAQAALLLGLLLHEEQRHVEAVEALEKASQLDPQNPYAPMYRGLSLLKLGRAQQARLDIEKAFGLAPGEPATRAALAELELTESNFGKAETLLRGVLSQTPNNLEAKTLLGRTLFEAGRPAEAVEPFREVLKVSPHDTEVLYLLAQALLRSGKRQEGRAALARFQEQRDIDEEARVLESAIAADKKDTASRIRLARLLVDQGLPNRALPHVAVLLELLPNDPRVLELAKAVERR